MLFLLGHLERTFGAFWATYRQDRNQLEFFGDPNTQNVMRGCEA